MTDTERQSIEALLAETIRLRDKVALYKVPSQRYPILCKDAARLQQMLRAA